MTHIKILMNKDYLGEWDLPEGNIPLILTIKSVSTSEVIGQNNKKSTRPILFFEEKGFKPMVLNATNAKAICKVAETPYIENWIGLKISLFRAKNVLAFGERMDAVRITPEKPILPFLNPENPRWLGAIKALKAGSVTLYQIKKSFQILPETLVIIETEIKIKDEPKTI